MTIEQMLVEALEMIASARAIIQGLTTGKESV